MNRKSLCNNYDRFFLFLLYPLIFRIFRFLTFPKIVQWLVYVITLHTIYDSNSMKNYIFDISLHNKKSDFKSFATTKSFACCYNSYFRWLVIMMFEIVTKTGTKLFCRWPNKWYVQHCTYIYIYSSLTLYLRNSLVSSSIIKLSLRRTAQNRVKISSTQNKKWNYAGRSRVKHQSVWCIGSRMYWQQVVLFLQ